jgi:LPS-assembly protein
MIDARAGLSMVGGTMRTRLLAGAAMLFACAGPAFGQASTTTPASIPERAPPAPEPAPIPTRAPSTPAPAAAPGVKGPDGLAEGGLYLEAETLTEDRENEVLTARGNVQARYNERTIRANEIVYERRTGIVRAKGKAQLINSDGTVQYADELVLDENLRAGVATGFAARLGTRDKLAAAAAVRRSESVNELSKAIFTPCEICDTRGQAKTPTWSIQADRAVQDRDKRLVYYRNATVRLFGLPALYAPVFWHPDPTAPAASGFLSPEFNLSNRRGLSYEQPYLWVISPSQDLVVSPQFSANVNPFLNLDYRKRFYSGQLQARVGYGYDRDFRDLDGDGDFEKVGDASSRSYILAEGAFQIDERWRWGFTAERVSDATLFDRYDVDDVYEIRQGLFQPDTRRLLSQLYAVRQTERSYVSVSALSFQGLRLIGYAPENPNLPGGPNNPSTRPIFEDNGLFPVVAPLIEARWEPAREIAGGRLRVLGSAVVLTRDEDAGDVFLGRSPDPTRPGVDSRRASAQADWRRAFILQNGLRIDPFVEARADLYNIGDRVRKGDNESVARMVGTAGVEVSYPLIRRVGSGALIIEPVAQLAVSPETDIDPRIPVEDGLVLEFDETNLFRPNKFPGFDLYEGGVRLNTGVRASANWGQGRRADVLVGRSFRDEVERAFLRPVPGRPNETYDPSGLADEASDWIATASVTPIRGLRLTGRTRVNDDFEVRRAEFGVDANIRRTRGFLRYGFDDVNSQGQRTQFAVVGGETFFSDRWGVGMLGTRDLEAQVWPRVEMSLIYQDDCARIEVVYERDETTILSQEPSQRVSLRLSLATLGAAGYTNYNAR